METYYPTSSAQTDVFSSPYGNMNMMMCFSDIPLDSSVNPANRNDQSFQGLSLSLNTHMSATNPASSFQFQYLNPELSSMKVGEASPSDPYGYNGTYQYEQQGCSGVGVTILKSRYLKVTRELLDEVVCVQDAFKRAQFEKEKGSSKVEEGSKDQSRGSEANERSGSTHELSPCERQELQSKLDELHSMLDEVDRRYKQYCQQMQVLASSFDVVAGNGSAKPYTTLALKTISRHFRYLRDAITNQIQVTRKSLGEEDNGVGGVIPRLRYVDQKLRQQRAFQQFGLMRHSWRPQRGLPENAVTILRAWLFEHFLHPYPKDLEKTLLARQAGLTRSQAVPLFLGLVLVLPTTGTIWNLPGQLTPTHTNVGNWFINARVRLWKPMIEDMYKEEFGEDIDTNPKSSQENPTSENHAFNGNGSIPSDPNGPGNVMANTYQIPELGNFGVGNNNQVSLALGLRHSEGDNSMEMSTNESTMPEYPYSNQQHIRFSNPETQIVSDFVT